MSAAVIHRQQNRIMRHFHAAGATRPDRAKLLSELTLRRSLTFRYLVRRGVIQVVCGDRFFLDEAVEREFRRRRLRFTVVVMTVGLILIALAIAIIALPR